MSTQVQRRKGTTAQHASFTGASAELTVDTTKNTVVVHDGATAGGIPLAKETGSAISVTTLAASGAVTLSGGTANGVAYLNGSKQVTTGTALTFTGTNLGIGIASPAYLLDARASIAVSSITSTSTTAGNQPTLRFQHSGNNTYQIKGGSDLQFLSDDGTNERMRLTNAGNLGIGTTSPSQKVEVTTSGTSAILITSTSGTAQLMLNPSGTNPAYINYNRTSASVLAFYDNYAAAERMRLDASGNLGLGVTPSAWGSSYKGFDVNTYGALSATTTDVQVTSNAYNNNSSWIAKITGAATRYVQTGGIHYFQNAPSVAAGAALTFSNAMTLDASGNLLVGTTSGIGRIGAAFPNSQYGFTASCSSASGTAIFNRFLYNTSTEVGSISSTGSVTLYNTTSDQRLKENIVDAPEFGSVIDSIKVRSYDWKTDQTHQRAGFIAQELVVVAPEAVHQPENPEDMMAVDYSKLVPMLVKEIQDLRKRLAAAGI